jgi:methyl-accepting chemotaxis protein
VLQAANGTKEVNANILSVTQTSEQSGRAASSLQEAANGLSSQSEHLKAEVDSFLNSLRVA